LEEKSWRRAKKQGEFSISSSLSHFSGVALPALQTIPMFSAA
jgi:hypothetical protein